MESGPPHPSIYHFGVFEFNAELGTLRRDGVPLRLEGHPQRLLACLLERHGEIVSREQLCDLLWPQGTFVEFEGSLNAAVRRLRSVLHDGAGSPLFIETVPRRGYRFIAPVEVETRGAVLPQPAAAAPRSRRWTLWVGMSSVGTAAAAALVLLLPAHAPRLVQIRRLSGYGIASPRIVSDGLRIYVSGHDKFDQPFQVFSFEGGEGAALALPLPRPEAIEGVAPDGSWLLVSTDRGDRHALWKVPLPAGSPQLLALPQGTDSAWSPDGKTIAYVDGRIVNLIASTGGPARWLAQLPGPPAYLVWSPDGRRLRMTIMPDGHDPSQAEALWEVEVPGGAAHPVLREYQSPATHPVGWTPDGSYFLFTAMQAGVSNLWAEPEPQGLRGWLRREPVKITAGPVSFRFPILSRSGSTVFGVGEQRRAELLRYDPKSGQFAPFFGGLPADQVAFSRDGQWAAYVSYPDGALWRCRSDGKERLQLTFAPLAAFLPHWSPDGSKIVFEVVDRPGHMSGALIGRDGGAVRPLLPGSTANASDFTWMPDGRHLLYTQIPAGPSLPARVFALDLQTGRSVAVPGLSGYALPSPRGRYIAVQGWADKRVTILDMKSRTSAEVAPSGDYLQWSADGSALYFNTMNDFPLDAHSGFRRYDIATGRTQTVLDCPTFGLTGVWGSWIGLTPDGSPLVLRSDTIRALYALDLQLK